MSGSSLQKLLDKPLEPSLLTSKGESLVRMPGLGLYYTDSPTGGPPVMAHVLQNMPALYDTLVFLTVKAVPVPKVDREEMILVRR
jgi:KUP system potassium uptake protein